MRRTLLILQILLAMAVCSGIPAVAYAQLDPPSVDSGYEDPGLYNPTVPATVSPYDRVFGYIPQVPSSQLTTERSGEQFILRVINWLLIFLGLIGFFYLILAGFLWATAMEKEDQITKARNIIIQVVIGSIVVLAAYAIVFTIVGGRGRLYFY